MIVPATPRSFDLWRALAPVVAQKPACHGYLLRLREDDAIEALAARREASVDEVLEEPALVALDQLRSEESPDAGRLRVALWGNDQNSEPLANRAHMLLLSDDVTARAAAYLMTRLARYSVLDWSRWDEAMGVGARDAAGA